MLLGYNTNGLAHHDLFDAVGLLADLGYRSVAITIDHTALPPYEQLPRPAARATAAAAGAVGDAVGNRDRRPVPLGSGREARADVDHRPAPRAAAAASSSTDMPSIAPRPWAAIAFRSGRGCFSRGVARPQAMAWLIEGLEEVLILCRGAAGQIGFEPEPGMLIDSMRGYEELLQQMDAAEFASHARRGPSALPGRDAHRRGHPPWAPRLVNVHLEDMRAGVHEHLMFGEGEIDFPPVFAALAEVGLPGRRPRGTESSQPRGPRGGPPGDGVPSEGGGRRAEGGRGRTPKPTGCARWERGMTRRLSPPACVSPPPSPFRPPPLSWIHHDQETHPPFHPRTAGKRRRA